MQLKPLLPWMGGKRRLAKHILPLFPEHECYVEPFCGGAAMLFMRDIPAHVEVINDINLELVTLYRVVQHHMEEFLRHFKWALVSRKMFGWLNNTPPETLTDIQRAARFYYLQKTCFGGRLDGRTFGYATTSPPRLNLLRIEEELSAIHLRLARCIIEHLPWHNCIERYDREHTLFYLDPPYWQTEGYGTPFGIDEYERLASLMRRIKGKAILSINDHPDMRQIFGGFAMTEVSLNYSLNNRGGKTTKAGEMIIRSWQG